MTMVTLENYGLPLASRGRQG